MQTQWETAHFIYTITIPKETLISRKLAEKLRFIENCKDLHFIFLNKNHLY
jgi:hypothetical protein